MYKIYANNHLIHALNLAPNKLVVSNPRLTEQVNTAASLDFTIAEDNPHYTDASLHNYVEIFEDNKRIFYGRIINTNRDFFRRKSAHCEDCIAFLNDIIIPPYTFNGTVKEYFAYLINWYNALCSKERELRVGECDIEDNINRASSVYPTIWEEINEKIIKKFDGFLTPRYEIENGVNVVYLDYLRELPIGSQKIRFGQNLIDLNDYLDGAEAYSVLVPLGEVINDKTYERLTVANANGGDITLTNQDLLEKLGYIYKKKEWDDVTLDVNLLRKGKEELQKAVIQTQTITISAVDLHLIDVATEALRTGHQYKVISQPHGLNEFFVLSKSTINLNNPDMSVYTFGKTKKTLTGGLTEWQQ